MAPQELKEALDSNVVMENLLSIASLKNKLRKDHFRKTSHYLSDSDIVSELESLNQRVDEKISLNDLPEGGGSNSIDVDLRAKLISTDPDKGTALVGRAVRFCESITDMLSESVALGQANMVNGSRMLVRSYAPNTGKGGGAFIYDANSTLAHNGGTVFKPSGFTGNGAWIRLYNIVEPQDFGAVGNGIRDDRLELQAFADFICASTTMIKGNMNGIFRVTGPVKFNGVNDAIVSLECHCEIRPNFNTWEFTLEFNNLRSLNILGMINIYGGSSQVFTAKPKVKGILFQQCQRFHIQFIKVDSIKGSATVFRGMSIIGHCEHIWANYCGSSGHVDNHIALTIHYSSFTRAGSNNNPNQTTTFFVTNTEHLDYLEPFDSYINLGGELYHVAAVDKAAGTVTVNPWVHSTDTPTTGSFVGIFGASVSIRGSDTGCNTFGSVDGIGTGIGFHNSSLYPATILNGTFQGCGIGYAIGQWNGAGLGGTLQNSYYEENVFDIAVLSKVSSFNHRIGINAALNYSKIVSPYARGMPTLRTINRTVSNLPIFIKEFNKEVSDKENPYLNQFIWAQTIGTVYDCGIPHEFSRIFGWRDKDIQVKSDVLTHKVTVNAPAGSAIKTCTERKLIDTAGTITFGPATTTGPAGYQSVEITNHVGIIRVSTKRSIFSATDETYDLLVTFM